MSPAMLLFLCYWLIKTSLCGFFFLWLVLTSQSNGMKPPAEYLFCSWQWQKSSCKMPSGNKLNSVLPEQWWEDQSLPQASLECQSPTKEGRRGINGGGGTLRNSLDPAAMACTSSYPLQQQLPYPPSPLGLAVLKLLVEQEAYAGVR